MGKHEHAPAPSSPPPRERTPALVRKVRVWLAVAIVVLLLMFALPRVEPPPGELSDPNQAFVDKVGIVSPAFAREWAGALLNDDRAQIAIFVDRRPPEGELSAWAIQTASKWRIGADKDDTGVVVFIFAEPRMARIDVGYGLEEKLTDARVRQLLETHLAPAFAAGQYEQGIDALVFAIRKEIGGYDADSIHARAAAARERDKRPWTTEVATAIERIPRVTVAIGKRFVEEGPLERLAMMVFIGVALGVLAAGAAGLWGALSALAAVPAALRQVRAGDASATKLGGIAYMTAAGFFVAFACVSLVAMVLLVSESYFTRQGRFSGAGAVIVWPEARR